MTRIFARVASGIFVIEETHEGVYLYSFDQSGIIGDTWHQSIADAEEQAAHWGYTGEWRPIPADITDLRTFIQKFKL